MLLTRTCSPNRRCVDPARRRTVAAAATDEVDEDLWQFKDRKSWYEARFSASDMPDWNPMTFLSSDDVGPGLRELTYVGKSDASPQAD